MQIHSLEINDFLDSYYTLIGVHTTLEDYQLAFLLNKHLKAQFKRASYDLDFENNDSFYSVYEYTNKKLDIDWFLISNIYKTAVQSTGLFSESETKAYLIPEKKRVDYFLKIEGDIDYEQVVKSVEKINQIPQVITSYQIETDKLKSKEFLIF